MTYDTINDVMTMQGGVQGALLANRYRVVRQLGQGGMGSNPSEFKGDSNPVENVSWNDCQEFVRKVNDAARCQFGGSARLPTERERTVAVGSYQPNAWGFCDMHGNVYEWCSDRYGSHEGDVLRGGSWNNNARYCRSARRRRSNPDFRGSDCCGFRLCCSALP